MDIQYLHITIIKARNKRPPEPEIVCVFLYTKKIVYNKFIIVYFSKNKHTNNANTKMNP